VVLVARTPEKLDSVAEAGVSCTVLCPGPVPTEWADIADAHQWRVGIAQVSSADVAQAAIDGMLEGKRSVLPGLVPKIVGIGGRFAAPQFPSAGAAPRPGVAALDSADRQPWRRTRG